MKQSLIYAIALLVFIIAPDAYCQDVFVCTFDKTSSASYNGEEWETERWKDNDLHMTFSLDGTGSSIVTGNKGIGRVVLNKNIAGLSIVETTESGNIISTIILKEKMKDGIYPAATMRSIALAGSVTIQSVNIGFCSCVSGSMEHAMSISQ